LAIEQDIPVIDERATRRRALVHLGAVIVLFGVAWPVLKIGIEGGATPLWFAAGRAGISAAVSFAFLLALGRLRRPRRADLPIILSVGILQLSCFFALSNLGLRLIPAGRSAVLAYTTSLWLVPLAALGGERVDGRRILGALLGLAGLTVLVDPLSITPSSEVLLGHGYLLLAALAWAIAIFHARRHAWRLGPLEALPWQMLVAAVLLTILAAWREPEGHIAPSPPALLSLAYLGVLAGPVATTAAVTVARTLPTLVSSIGFLGTPVLGVTLSTLWLGERLSLDLVAGGLLVLVGIAVVATGRR
jgi:drug/metabolite transporter (DMT)-like permease